MIFIHGNSSWAANEAPQSVTLDGVLYRKGTTSPLTDSNVQLKIQILNPTATCLLYEESQTVDTSTTKGYFNIQVGSSLASPKRAVTDPGNLMARIFQNAVAIPAANAPSQTCAGLSYVPAAADIRYCRITVTPSSTSVADVLTPDILMNSVPQAIVAQSLQGLERAQVLVVNTAGGVSLSQSNLETAFTGTAWTNLQSILSGNFLRTDTSGATLPSYASTPAGVSIGDMWYDSATNEIKYQSNAGTQTLGATGAVSGSSITSGTISGNTAINTTGNLVTTGNVSGNQINGATVIATTISGSSVQGTTLSGSTVQAANLRIFNGAQYVQLTAQTMSSNYSLALPPADGISGQVMATNGSGVLSWITPSGGVAGTISVGQGGTNATSFAANRMIASNGTGTALQAVGCSLNQVLSFDVTGNYGCYNLSSIAGSQFIANGGNSTGAAVSLGTNDNQPLQLKSNNTVAMTISQNGNIGLGTGTPSAKLHVNGSLAIEGGGVAWGFTPHPGGSYVGFGFAGTSITMANQGISVTNISGSGATPLIVKGIGGQVADIVQFKDSTNANLFSVSAIGYVGIGGASPSSALDVSGALTARGLSTAPSVSDLNTGRIYFDYTTNKFRVSENGGAYVDLVGTGGSVSGAILNGGNSTGAAISIGTNDNQALQFKTNNSAAMTISQNGNVGISTSTLGAGGKLQIQKVVSTISGGMYNWEAGISIGDIVGTGNTLHFGTDQARQMGYIQSYRSGGSTLALNPDTSITSGKVGINTFAPTNALSVNGSADFTGDVGIGTSTPASRLHISNPAAGPTRLSITNQGSAPNNSNGVSALDFYALYSSPSYRQNAIESQVVADSSNGAADLLFKGKVAATDNTLTEFMRIATGGYVGIGTASPATALDMSGAFTARGLSSAPSVAPSNQGRIYFDYTANKFRVSENGGAYQDLVGTGGSVSGAFVDGGNTVTAAAVLGTNSNHPLQLETNNTVAMTISQNGNVGVGTLAPQANLHILRSAASTAIFDSSGTGTYTSVQLSKGGTSFGELISYGSNADFHITARHASGKLQLAGGGGSGHLVVDASGNVGIGIPTPGAPLSFAQNTGDKIRLFDPGAGGQAGIAYQNTGVDFYLPTGQYFKFHSGGQAPTDSTTEVFRIQTDGSVGIGTDSPTSALDISGSLTARGLSSAPSVSPSNQGRIFFDYATNKFRVSENGGAYVDLVGAGGSISGTISVGQGGTNSTSFTANRIIASNGTGSALQSVGCAPNQVISFDGSGNYACYNLSSIAGSQFIANGGNSTGADISIGTNDNKTLSFKTNNSTAMTISQNGNVGIGTTTPSSLLTVNGAIQAGASYFNASTYWMGVNHSEDPAYFGALNAYKATDPTGGAIHAATAGTNNDLARYGILLLSKPNSTWTGATNAHSNGHYLSGIGFAGQTNTTPTSGMHIGASIIPQVDNTVSSGIIPTALTFNTTLTNNTGLSEKMRITSAGNVGIGTNSPSTTLDISGAFTARGLSSAPSVSASNQGRIFFDYATNKFRVSENGGAYVDLVSTSFSGAIVNGGNTTAGSISIGTNDNQALSIKTNNTTAIIISQNGKVGIGVTNPDYVLKLLSSDETGAVEFGNNINPAGIARVLTLYGSYSGGGGGTGIGAGIVFKGETSSGSPHELGSLQMVLTDGTHATRSGAMLFNTVDNASAASEKMRITSTGNVGIGNSAPKAKLDVSGQVRTPVQSITTGALDWSGGNTIMTSFDCSTNLTMANMLEGASYTLIVTSTGTTACNFSTTTTGDDAATVSYRFVPANAVRTASSHTVYSMMRAGNTVYISWITGF